MNRPSFAVGSWIFDEPSRPSRHNASFIAIDVAAIAPPEQFEMKLRTLIDGIHAAPTAEGVERVQLPGEREWACYRQALTEGIDLPPDVIDKLREAASQVGLQPPWLRPE